MLKFGFMLNQSNHRGLNEHPSRPNKKGEGVLQHSSNLVS